VITIQIVLCILSLRNIKLILIQKLKTFKVFESFSVSIAFLYIAEYINR